MEHTQSLIASVPQPETDSREVGYWQKHFASWRESGLNQREYCAQEQLSRHRFRYWRRKLEPESIEPRSRSQSSEKKSSGFVPLQVQSRSPQSGLTLSFPNGLVLGGIAADNVALVKQLVAEL